MTDPHDMNEPEGAPEVAGFQQFEFALTDALIVQLVAVLDSLEPAPLNRAHVSAIPNGQGVYQLFYNGKLEYVGKTDTDAGLTTRLAKHASKTAGRPNLRGNVTFKAVQVLVFSAMELETMLIRHYKSSGSAMSWQHSGFGSNDPGRRRDGTRYKDNHFDVKHPIDIDEALPRPFEIKAGQTISEGLDSLKSMLPYIFRFEKTSELDQEIGKNISAKTMRDAIVQIIGLLPTGWQATRLPGYVIMYRENRDYLDGEPIAAS